MNPAEIVFNFDPEAQERVVRNAREETAITCLRIMRRAYGDHQAFMDNASVREIALFFNINLTMLQLTS